MHIPTWKPRGIHRRRLIIALIVVTALLLIGIVPRTFRWADAQAVVRDSPVLRPNVLTIRPKPSPSQTSITLPGNLQPLYAAALFARTNGYIEKRLVDIGSHVEAGQLLAVISTPEIDQQLNQAHADESEANAAVQQSKAALVQAQANLQIARITRDRYAQVIDKRAVTPQSLDEANQALNARTADVAAARARILLTQAALQSRKANVERLLRLQEFERVVAPFAGVITVRNVEAGDLVNDGSGGGSRSLFNIAHSETLRVQVEIPQSVALAIKKGQRATLTVQERAGRRYVATVTRSAESVDVIARTMLTEVEVDNSDGSLVPGMYGEVQFDIPAASASFVIPSMALVIDKNGMHVISVGAGSRVHIIPVEIGQDHGAEVEISQGLHGDEILVSNPSDLLSEGQQVAMAR